MFTAILAMDQFGRIGKGNELPWSLKEDLTFFKEMTENKTVVVGLHTLRGIGRLLPNRKHIVVTHQSLADVRAEFPDTKNASVETVISSSATQTLSDALLRHYHHFNYRKHDIVIIGGAKVYAELNDVISTLYVTHVQLKSHVNPKSSEDVYAPMFPQLLIGRSEVNTQRIPAADFTHDAIQSYRMIRYVIR